MPNGDTGCISHFRLDNAENRTLSQTLRKLIGTVLLFVLVILYALVAMTIATARLADSSAWVHLLYFFITGILWVLPAMAIVSWMLKPDED